jgi:phage shock protein C
MKMDSKRTRGGPLLRGICFGLGKTFNINVTIIRLTFIFFAFINGIGAVIYILIWILLPDKIQNDYI